MKALFTYLSFFLSTLFCIMDSPKENGYLLIGDSRMVGMEQVCECKENEFILAKTGAGLSFLETEGIKQIEKIKEEHPEIEKWTILSNFGVNDLYRVEDYISFYQTIEDDFIFISVNPVDTDLYVSNEEITFFNEKMKEVFLYMDTYTFLVEEGFESPDHLHYSQKTYEDIYNYITTYLTIKEKLHENKTAIH